VPVSWVCCSPNITFAQSCHLFLYRQKNASLHIKLATFS
jgi:hypothetical protein